MHTVREPQGEPGFPSQPQPVGVRPFAAPRGWMEMPMPTPRESPSSRDDDDALIDRTRSAIADLRRSLSEMGANAEERGKAAFAELDEELKRWLGLLEQRAGGVTDEARLQARLGFMEVTERAHALDDVFKDAMASVRHKLSTPAATFDRARVQAHLARLDAEEAVKERTDRVRAALESAQHTARHPLKAAEQKLADLLHAWAGLYH